MRMRTSAVALLSFPDEVLGGRSPRDLARPDAGAKFASPAIFVSRGMGGSRDHQRGVQPKTSVAAPPAMSNPPITLCAVSPSPKKSQAKRITSTTLSLSIGATADAGPSCSARK
jgi:hypothetical protein